MNHDHVQQAQVINLTYKCSVKIEFLKVGRALVAWDYILYQPNQVNEQQQANETTPIT